MKRTEPDFRIPYTPERLIKETAYEIGFSGAGIATIRPSEKSGLVFDRWIDKGCHGEMRYLEGGRDKRHHPELLLEGAQSVISVAVNYFSERLLDKNRAAVEAGDGIFSLYAQARDYHEVLNEMLSVLDARIRDFFPGMRSRICVDTQPISERDFALRAGVGWLGKNAMVISPEDGSWIFLGELITDLSLAADEPLETLCGSCTRCSDACPTGALDEPFTVDATRCISYLTIEKRGEIPGQYHEAIGPWVFGCDECQIVCPFNAHVRDGDVFGATCSPIVERPLPELASMDEDAFRRLSRGSAVRRAKAAGLRRNAHLVLENQRRR